MITYSEKIAVLCTPAMPTHAIRWADSRAELWGGGMIITELSDSQKETWEKRREEKDWERQYGKIPSGKQILQLHRNREK